MLHLMSCKAQPAAYEFKSLREGLKADTVSQASTKPNMNDIGQIVESGPTTGKPSGACDAS